MKTRYKVLIGVVVVIVVIVVAGMSVGVSGLETILARFGLMSVETDETVLAVIGENADKFTQFTYEDETTGKTLEYD